jgi:hypothetical protein
MWWQLWWWLKFVFARLQVPTALEKSKRLLSVSRGRYEALTSFRLQLTAHLSVAVSTMHTDILFPEQVSVPVQRMCTPLLPSAEVKQRLGGIPGPSRPVVVWNYHFTGVYPVGITTETSADVTWSFHAFSHFLQRSAESRIRHNFFLPFLFQFIVPKSGLHLALGWTVLLKDFVKWSRNECSNLAQCWLLVTSHFPNKWPRLPPHPLTDSCLFERNALYVYAAESKIKADVPVEELQSMHCKN